MTDICICCQHCGESILVDGGIFEVKIKEEAWQKAQAHLFDMLVSAIENFEAVYARNVLVPLKRRFDKGERTYKLYKSIMELKATPVPHDSHPKEA